MINETLLKIINSRCGGRVERCHTIPHSGSYNNAAHSWGVTMLLYYLFPDDYERLSIYCLSHDIGEGWIGDIPSPTLRAFPELKAQVNRVEDKLIKRIGCPVASELPEEDQRKIKECDALELYFWCQEQLAMGNLYVADCVRALEDHFDKLEATENISLEAFNLYHQIHLHSLQPEMFTPRQNGIVDYVMNVDDE